MVLLYCQENRQGYLEMGKSGFVIGLVVVLGFIMSIYIPSSTWFKPFNWLNWVNISIATLGLVLSAIGAIQGKQRGFGIAGLVLCGSVIILGALKLMGW